MFPRLRLIYGVLSWLLLFHGAGLCGSVVAQVWQCDPELKRKERDPLGYQLREERCEGVYVRDVASTTLHVVSFVESFGQVDLKSGRSLTIAWNSPSGETVHLRAEAVRRQLNYRMDSIRPGNTRSYSWPTDGLAKFALTPRELGIVARISYPMAGTNHAVYIPVQVSQQAAPSPSNTYKVSLVPGAELAEVFISLAPVKGDGRLGSFIIRDKPLAFGFYPAEQRIDFDISKPKPSGIYALEIGVRLRAGGSASTKLWFYSRP